MKLTLDRRPSYDLRIEGKLFVVPPLESIERLVSLLKEMLYCGHDGYCMNDDGVLVAHQYVGLEDDGDTLVWWTDDDDGDSISFSNGCGDVCYMLGESSKAIDYYCQAHFGGATPPQDAKRQWIVWEREGRDAGAFVPPFSTRFDTRYDEDYCRNTVSWMLMCRGEFRLNTRKFDAAALDFKNALQISHDDLRTNVEAAAAAWAKDGFPKQASVLEQVILDASQ